VPGPFKLLQIDGVKGVEFPVVDIEKWSRVVKYLTPGDQSLWCRSCQSGQKWSEVVRSVQKWSNLFQKCSNLTQKCSSRCVGAVGAVGVVYCFSVVQKRDPLASVESVQFLCAGGLVIAVGIPSSPLVPRGVL
jgi:hypothetical protein